MTPSHTPSICLDSTPEPGFIAGSACGSRADDGLTSLGGGLSTVLRAEGSLAVVESVGSFLLFDADTVVVVVVTIVVAVAAGKTDRNRRGADGLYHVTAGF